MVLVEVKPPNKKNKTPIGHNLYLLRYRTELGENFFWKTFTKLSSILLTISDPRGGLLTLTDPRAAATKGGGDDLGVLSTVFGVACDGGT